MFCFAWWNGYKPVPSKHATSIDIDLTYFPFSSREEDFRAIRMALDEVKRRLQKRIPRIQFSNPQKSSEDLKLLCSIPDATVKIEVNQINRGLIGEPRTMVLCDEAQQTFDRFCEVQVVPDKQLWGGKIIAALDRQHPRDLFDIRNLLTNIGFSDEIKTGFLFFLLCSNRPAHELLQPKFINQHEVFNSQFNGMTTKSFSYREFEEIREQLVKIIHKKLTLQDKEFLLAFTRGEPIWKEVDYSMYPAVKWKMLNLKNLGTNNPQKFHEQVYLLEQSLDNK